MGRGRRALQHRRAHEMWRSFFVSTPTAQMVRAPGNLVRWFHTLIPEWFGSLKKQGRNFPWKHFLPILRMLMCSVGMLAWWNLLAHCPSDTLDSQEGSVGRSVGHWGGHIAAAGGSCGNIWEWGHTLARPQTLGSLAGRPTS